MNILDFNDNDVVSIDGWKKKVELSKESKSISEYLNLLSYNELINESEHTALELKGSPLNHNLLIRSKLILKEFNTRLYCTSNELSTSISDIGNTINKNFNNLIDLI